MIARLWYALVGCNVCRMPSLLQSRGRYRKHLLFCPRRPGR